MPQNSCKLLWDTLHYIHAHYTDNSDSTLNKRMNQIDKIIAETRIYRKHFAAKGMCRRSAKTTYAFVGVFPSL